MTPEEIAAQEEAERAAEAEAAAAAAAKPAPSQEPKRTEAEKAAFSLKKNAERARELGLNPEEILGVKPQEKSDEIPEWYKREKSNEIKQTALQMAEAIPDEDTRTAVKEALDKRVAASGNAEDDFRFALGAVSASKNRQIIEELNRYAPPGRTAAGGSRPAPVEDEFTPTAEEAVFMGPPYNVPKEKIIAARKK